MTASDSTVSGLSVGTANAGKLQAVRRALALYPLLARLEVLPQKVESGVSDQPSTLEETTRGASNRARAAAARGGGRVLISPFDRQIPCDFVCVFCRVFAAGCL